MSKDFHLPDWTSPENFKTRLADLPDTARTRGMFFNWVADVVEQQTGKRPEMPNYVGFKEYPMREFIEFAERSAKAAFPGQPARTALRKFGQRAYPGFASTMAGKAIFSIAARDWTRTLELASKAYEIAITPGKAEVAEMKDNHAIIELRDVWSFVDSYQIGVFEGTMTRFDLRGDIKVRIHSPCDADLLISWA